MEMIFENIISELNILYIFLCNIITYLIIKSIPNDIHTLWKRGISAIVATVLGVVGVLWLNWDKEAVFCSFFVQFLLYDYVIKSFLKKFDTNDDIVAGEQKNQQQ